MHKTLATLLFSIAVVPAAMAQECNCSESFNWMVTTFEQNDAGFRYVVDKKGTDAYEAHTSLLRAKAKTISSVEDCQSLMYSWLLFFRKGHIGVGIKETAAEGKDPTAAEIREQYKNEKKVTITEKQLREGKQKDRDPIEGIWTNGMYTIGIARDEHSSNKLNGFIIKADSLYWMPGQVKVVLSVAGNTYTAEYAMQNHIKRTTTAKLVNKAGSLLLLNNDYWERIYPIPQPLSKKEQLLLSFSKSPIPFVEQLSANTLYLRIPSFQHEQKKYIDSVLAANDSRIKAMPNLIIDIRNGTGGADDAYSNILPYIYTNPTRETGVQYYGTEMNAQAFEKYAKAYTDTGSINYLNGIAAKMRLHKGEFVSTSALPFSIDTLPVVMPYPRKVAIICNENNGSTDEQFLITAKQSNKVKVYGRPTGGMLDISNLNVVDFPDGKFYLAYCMSKSYRIPHYCIDGIGIQPDYFIDDAVNEDEWIEYTRTVLEQ